MTPELLDQCTAGAFDGSVPFLATVAKITDDGAEWYSANLIFGITTYYGKDLGHHQTKWPHWTVPKIGEPFAADQVLAAIRASQSRQITYPEFLQQIARAGVVYYTVHLMSRKAIYFGRHGEFYIEPFPAV